MTKRSQTRRPRFRTATCPRDKNAPPPYSRHLSAALQKSHSIERRSHVFFKLHKAVGMNHASPDARREIPYRTRFVQRLAWI
jgi:hypothetical protein